jgi:hypothetical protein
LCNAGVRVEVVHPDKATKAAFASVHGNLLGPAVRGTAARAGRAQGRSIAARIAHLWDLASWINDDKRLLSKRLLSNDGTLFLRNKQDRLFVPVLVNNDSSRNLEDTNIMGKLSAFVVAAALATASLSTAALAQDYPSQAPGAELGAGITANPSANRDGDLNGPAAGLGGNFGTMPGKRLGAEMGYGITENPSANRNGDVNAPAAGNGGDFGAKNSGSTEGQITDNPSANRNGEANAPAAGNGGDFTPPSK